MTQINAIDEAIRGMNGIPFVDFTTDLIDGVFDSLVDNHTTQMMKFVDYFEGISKGLQWYIDNTEEDISDEETLQYLTAIEGAESSVGSGSNPPTLLDTVASATPAGAAVNVATPVVTNLLDALNIPGVESSLPAASSGNTTSVKPYAIRTAIARRISANRYNMLETMIKQGMMRLVVDHGEIETRFTMSTRERHLDQVKIKTKDKNKSSTKSKTKVGTGFMLSMFGSAKKKVKRQNKQLHVKKVNENHRDISGSSTKFYSRVKIVFKTDYMPLDGA